MSVKGSIRSSSNSMDELSHNPHTFEIISLYVQELNRTRRAVATTY